MYACLPSPQHWAQQTADNFPMKRGTWCATYGDAYVMQWNQRNPPRLSTTIATRIHQRCILRQDWLTIALNCAYKILNAKLQIMRKRSHFLLKFPTKRCKLSRRSKTHKKIWRTSLRWKTHLCALVYTVHKLGQIENISSN